MASFIYFYSKFTEELLLLSAAGIFTLSSIYCYTWVVKKRRLGAARDQVPAGMVKVYLSQLINEAQFVRTQLFGLAGGTAVNADQFAAHFQGAASGPGTQAPTAAAASSASPAEVPSDLWERLKALEAQLADKESMVVNINVEKTKLLEEVENLKQNEKAMGAASSGNNEDLIDKIKALEERLEEYALFEDDLANLKRLQQENIQLKKQVEQGAAAGGSSAPSVTPIEAPIATSILDQAARDALLNGVSAVPPTPREVSPPAAAAAAEAPSNDTPPEPTAINSLSKTPALQTAVDPAFENLVDSVENSLTAKPPAEPAPVAAAEASGTVATPEQMAAPAQASSGVAEKSDEELLKEFENLLNS